MAVFPGVLAALALIETILNIFGWVYTALFVPPFHPPSREPGTVYIFCIGDSFAYGIGAGPGESYPRQLETVLNEPAGGQRYKVFNLGMPAYNSSQALDKLKKSIKQFKPDFAIVCVGYNDSWNFNHALAERARVG